MQIQEKCGLSENVCHLPRFEVDEPHLKARYDQLNNEVRGIFLADTSDNSKKKYYSFEAKWQRGSNIPSIDLSVATGFDRFRDFLERGLMGMHRLHRKDLRERAKGYAMHLRERVFGDVDRLKENFERSNIFCRRLCSTSEYIDEEYHVEFRGWIIKKDVYSIGDNGDIITRFSAARLPPDKSIAEIKLALEENYARQDALKPLEDDKSSLEGLSSEIEGLMRG